MPSFNASKGNHEMSIYEFTAELLEIDEIVEMSGNFYREGGFDDVCLGEMLFSVACILGIEIP